MTPYLSQRREELIRTYRDGLLRDVIPFWMKHGLDRVNGGMHTALGRKGELLDSDKSVWFQGRAAWTFANLFNTVERRPSGRRPRFRAPNSCMSVARMRRASCISP